MSDGNDDVIKNKMRGVGKVSHSHTPAHIEMNLDPVRQELGSNRDFDMSKSPLQKRGLNIPQPKLPSAEPVFTMDDEGISAEEMIKEKDSVISTFVDNNDDYFPTFKENKKEIEKPLVNGYIVMIKDQIVYSGDYITASELVKSIVYGENDLYKDVLLENIVVLKRLNIKVGVFLDE